MHMQRSSTGKEFHAVGPATDNELLARVLTVVVCLSVRLSQIGALLKRLNVGWSRKQHNTVVQEL